MRTSWLGILLFSVLHSGMLWINADEEKRAWVDLTLPEAQTMLRQNNPDLQAAIAQVRASHAAVAEARAAWLPSLDAVGSYHYATEVGQIEFPLPNPPGGTLSRELGDRDRAEAGIEVGYLVFAGGARRHEGRARREESAAAEARVRALTNRLVLQLGMQYLAWELACHQSELSLRLLALREAQVKRTEAMRIQGMATSAALAGALAAEATALAERAETEGRRDSLAAELSYLIGVEVENYRPVAYEIPNEWPAPEPTETESAEARAMRHGLESLRAGREAVSAQRWPRLGATVGWKYANPGLNIGSDEFMDYGHAGFSLRWNLFDGMRRRAQVRQLDARSEAMRHELSRVEAGFSKARKLAKIQVNRWKTAERAAAASVAAAVAYAENVRELAAGKMISDVEVTEADTRVLQAQQAEAAARMRVRAARLQWQYAAGMELKF